MADRLNIGARFVNSRMDPKFCIRASIAGELITVNVELEQIIDSHERRTHSGWKDEPVGARDTSAHVSECCGDSLLV